MAANFSAIMLSEPEKDEMLNILAGVKKHFEAYYSLRIPGALFECVYTLAQRFIPTRAFPDKAIELLDMACSKASLKKTRTLDCAHIHQSISMISRLPIGIVRHPSPKPPARARHAARRPSSSIGWAIFLLPEDVVDLVFDLAARMAPRE